MENFSVVQLKKLLREKELSASGVKSELITRLMDKLMEESIDVDEYVKDKLAEFEKSKTDVAGKSTDDAVQPGDSASQVSKASVVSERVQESAKRAALEARKKMMAAQQRIELEKIQILQREQMLKLETELAETVAREHVLKEHEGLADVSAIEDEGGRQSDDPLIEEQETPVQLNCSKRTTTVYGASGRQQSETDSISARVKQSSNGGTSQRPAEDILNTLVTFNMKSLMPKSDIQKFGGDCTQFQSFLRAFDSVISDKLVDDQEKLHYLGQYTMGKPLDIVKACMHMPSDLGYKEARRRLEKRYGNPDMISASYVDLVLKFPKMTVDEVERLDEYSILLGNCRNAIFALPGAREVDHPKTIREIIGKLPYPIQERWRIRVDGLMECGEIVNFDHLVNFVEVQARIANNPVYGRQNFSNLQKSDQRKPAKTSGGNKLTCNVVDMSKLKCWYCDGSHFLDQCKQLIEKSYDDRRDYLMKNRLCFNCTSRSHTAKTCKRRRICAKCRGPHNTLMHNGASSELTPKELTTVSASTAQCARGEGSRMNVVPVTVHAPSGRYVRTYAFIDSGSKASFCAKSLCHKLGIDLDENNVELKLSTVLPKWVSLDSNVINNLRISDLDFNHFIDMPPVFTLDSIPASPSDIVTPQQIEGWAHLREIYLPQVNGEIEIMIGNNVPKVMEPWEILHSPESGGPYAVRTILGWMVCGLPLHSASANPISVNKVEIERMEIKNILLELYNREFKDLHSSKPPYSQDDRRWLDIVASGCKSIGGHYQIPLPLDIREPLVASRRMALSRLKHLKCKMLKDNKYKIEYSDFMDDMLRNGFAEKVPQSEVDNFACYIPHFGVTHPQKRKVRIVYDCAATSNGTSLNDLLLQGPDLVTQLLLVLIRFRLGKYAYTADISKMFYQVTVPPEDRDFLRYFWWDSDVSTEACPHRLTVHLFGAKSSPSVATYALQRTAEDNVGRFPQEVLDGITRHFYVDDHLQSHDNEQELAKIARLTRELCARGGFNLTKFITTSRLVIQSLPEEALADDIISSEKSSSSVPSQKILGVGWDVKKDRLFVDFKVNEVNTRRQLLRLIASMYDPIGLAAPFILEGRVLLQESCRLKLKWDEPFSTEFKLAVDKWVDRRKEFRVYVPRNMLSKLDYVQLHLFSDASLKGYGVVAYLRFDNSISFVFGKARVAPLKQVLVPRLELSAAALAVDVKDKLHEALTIPLKETFYWTDSTTVLRYLNNDTCKYQIFVANRVSKIKDKSSAASWRYVPSEINPADQVTRGRQNEKWLLGPEFLIRPPSTWPVFPANFENLDTDGFEVCMTGEIAPVTEEPLTKLINRYSSLHSLKKAVAYIIKFTEYIRNRNVMITLTPLDLESAENTIAKHVQSTYYRDEIKLLSRSEGAKLRNLKKLCPFIDKVGLLRVGGRLSQANLPFSVAHPIILPYKSHLTDLIVKATHERVGHMGLNVVLSELRNKYWIMKGGKAVKRIIGQCISCRKLKRPPVQQQMADLPDTNVAIYDPPFSNTGLDCIGPFFTKRGRAQVKRYGLIFVCLTVKAVHIEMLEEMTTSSFICGLRRFLARRGSVKVLRSDCGSNFRGASKELKQVLNTLDHVKIGGELLKREVKWIFNTPHASHHGGSWERQIRTVRRVLTSLLLEQILTDESLRTLFCEVELIINNRPLTTCSNDNFDLLPLTPSQLLTMKTAYVPAPEVESPVHVKWKQVQYLADIFWKRWSKEYLLTLQERQKWLKKQKNVKVGDVVLLNDPAKPRNQWPLAIVTSVKCSSDGHVRSVTVRMGGTEVTRPISKLIMILEADSS